MRAVSGFDGPAVLLYLTFLSGLCIGLSTLACALFCTAPLPHAHGRLATLRRRGSNALHWGSDGSSGAEPWGASDAGSAYGDGTSRDLGGLRIFTGVVRAVCCSQCINNHCKYVCTCQS